MATINGLTAEAMEAIREAVIIGAAIDGDNLILYTFGGATINAGSVRGPQGVQGPIGQVSDAELAAAVATLNATISAHHAAGAISSTELAANAVTSGKINDAAVTSAKIADAAVVTAKINDAAVTSAKLVDNAVTAAKLAANAVTNTSIGTNAVSNTKIGAQAVTEDKLSDALAVENAAILVNGWTGYFIFWKIGNIVSFNFYSDTGSLGASANAICNLPAGYRPGRTTNFPAQYASAAAGIYIETNGNVTATEKHNFMVSGGSFIAFS